MAAGVTTPTLDTPTLDTPSRTDDSILRVLNGKRASRGVRSRGTPPRRQGFFSSFFLSSFFSSVPPPSLASRISLRCFF